MKSHSLLARTGALLLIAALAGCGSVGGDATSGPAASDVPIATLAGGDGATSGPVASAAASTDPAASTGPNADGVMTGDLTAIGGEIPAYDPAAPAPSMGGAALRALAVLDPGVAVLEGDVEAAERAALTAALADLPVRPTGDAGSGTGGTSLVAQTTVWRSEGSTHGGPNVALAALARPSVGDAGASAGQAASSGDAAVFLTALVLGLDDLLNRDMPPGAGTSGSGTDTIGGAKATLSLDVGRSTEGATRFGLGIKTDASKDGVTATTDAAAHIEGVRCPDANGRVAFTVKVRFGADSGSTALMQDLTATVTANVNEDATIGNSQIDVVQGTRRVKDGRQAYVESGETFRFVGDDTAAGKSSNLRAIRISQQATFADVQELSSDGLTAALRMGVVALGVSEINWRDGACVKIVAASPGQVAPGSTTPIPVKVLGKFDGADVPSRLDAALTGGASIDPTSLAKTPGTLSYKAPDERNKTATIALTATSRRGIAKLALTANTGGGAAYHFAGGLQDFQVNQDVCDIMAPFTLDGTIGIAQFSGGLTGTYVVTGIFDIHYEGTYVITLPNGPGQPGSMVATSSGSISGAGGSGSETYTLKPLTSCG